MAYVALFFLLLSAASFAVSLGYFIATCYAKTGESFMHRRLCGVGHCGWGILYLAACGLILIVNAVVSL
jgi:hypothetical protein